MSARVKLSATASLPEMRSSLSSPTAGAVCVAVAAMSLSPPPLIGLVLSVLARDACRDLHTAEVEVGLDLLVVLAAEAEAVRAYRSLLVTDLGAEPGLVAGLVLPPHLPLAGVVLELGLVDHRDAVLDRAHRLAYAAAAARLHIGVKRRVRHDVEAGVRARDPAEVALHAGVEVDHRAHGAGRELLEVGVALGHVPLAVLLGLADGDGRDRDAFAHLPPLRLLEGVGDLRVALGDLDLPRLQPLVGLAGRGDLQVCSPLHFLDRLADGVEREEGRRDLD